MSADPDDTEDSGPARPRWPWVLVAACVLVSILVGMALLRGGDDGPAPGLTVGWGGSEGHPSCVYDPETDTVDARLTIDGEAPSGAVTVTVTAYADENTSKPVGSSSRSVHLEGTVHQALVVTIHVDRAPFVDVDGETACSLSVED